MSAAVAGVLLLDKPVGLSSNAALQTVRRLAGGIKAGHTGSLDPLASGMLPICLGEATKLAGEMLCHSKCYRFGVQLGERSETGDAQGAIIERRAVPAFRSEQLSAVLARFCGVQQQIPPMYSALKRQGEPLYRLARRGLQVEREPRSVTIEALELLGREPERLQLRVLCSKGTYVRVLGEDIAQALGTCGRLYELRREFVQPFGDQPMATLQDLQAAGSPSEWPILPADRAVSHLPALHLDLAGVKALAHGKVLAAAAQQCGTCRLYDPDGRFVGLGQADEALSLRVLRLFAAAQQ
ncbi:MAG TPA: tRNA pseudouridine(55) synthase TruB [Steroidobacteraceae bacterium]|nr:tRNA pseudouridine(55) synthase TruB [Steroidobacteraceae bacterium]